MLITAVGTRFVGMESATDDNVGLIDRLTGSVYRCKALERGKASCDTDIATGSIGERAKAVISKGPVCGAYPVLEIAWFCSKSAMTPITTKFCDAAERRDVPGLTRCHLVITSVVFIPSELSVLTSYIQPLRPVLRRRRYRIIG